MQTSRGSGKEGQGQQYTPGQPYQQGGQPGQSYQQGGPPYQQGGQPGQPYQQGGQPPAGSRAPVSPDESQIGNVTIFRTAAFFVHAVKQRTSALRSASGNTTLIERVRWVSTERQRVADVQTRLLPQVELFNPVQREIIIPAWFEAMVVIIALVIATAVHAINIFGFPLYQADEGLLMARAWAVTNIGNLTAFGPFPYDQTPFGWILIAGWSFVTGGFSTFGSAINSGRALMLGLSFGGSLLVYLITSRVSGSRSAGLLALLLFALSPLGITYQRQVMLDNIGIFWLLLSLFLVIGGNSRLPVMVFSGFTFAFAVLSKEIFIIFYPVMLYAVWLHATEFQRKFSLVTFTYSSLAVMSFFGLAALLSNQLGDFWNGNIAHVQSAIRDSNFLLTWNEWLGSERLLFIISAVALLVNALGGIRNRIQWLSALLLITPWVFILATNIVFSSYFVILLPFMALNIAVALNGLVKFVSSRVGFDLVRVLLIFALIGAMTPYRVQAAQVQGLTEQNLSANQVQALTWLRANVPQDAVVIVNSYLFADLHSGSKNYTDACYYRDQFFTTNKEKIGNWKYIDYIVLDDQMRQEIRVLGSQMSTYERALHSAQEVFRNGSVVIYHIDHEKFPRNPKDTFHCFYVTQKSG